MKLVQSSVVALALFAASSNGQWDSGGDCEGCVENADIFQQCVKDYCLDEAGEYGVSKRDCLAEPLYTDMKELAICCDMSDRSGRNECEDAGESINGCLDNCLPDCVEDTIYNYMNCYTYRQSAGCDLGDCITKIALDKEWVGDELNNEDEFFKALQESLQEGSASDKLECSGAEEKATEVCRIGKSCCDNCNNDLGIMMDCIVNTVVRPWQMVQFNEDPDDYDDCETECDRLGVDRRDLAEDASASASLTGDAAQDKAIRDQSAIAAKPCLDNMRSAIAVSGNMTAIGTDTINCVVVESARVLQTDETTDTAAKDGSKESSATSVTAASIASAFLAAAAVAAV